MTWWFEIAQGIAAIATSIGVLVAAWQIRESRHQAMTSFEDSLAKQYRDIIHSLPASVVMGEHLSDEAYAESFDDLFRYVDLCNEQVFLWLEGRLSPQTWASWAEGITSNLKKPAFQRAWQDIQRRTDSFEELRVFENCDLHVSRREFRSRITDLQKRAALPAAKETS